MKRTLLILFFLLILLVLALAGYQYHQRQQQEKELILYGNVDVRQVDLGFRVSGRVIEMPFQEGDIIKKGTLIGKLDKQPYTDQVKQAKANLESIKITQENANKVALRRQELVDSGSVSREDLDNSVSNKNTLIANLQEAEASLGVAMKNFLDTEVYAPNDGVILTRIREPGSVVKAADPIYTLSLIDPVWIRAFVSEKELGEIFFGMKAEVYIDAKKEPYQAHIGFISPVAEFTPKTVETLELRSDLVYRLRVIADNPDQFLKQGMPVTVKLLRENK